MLKINPLQYLSHTWQSVHLVNFWIGLIHSTVFGVLVAMLSEMGDVLENEDWILLADLLEYEFIPQCDEWRSTSEVLHQQVIEHMCFIN